MNDLLRGALAACAMVAMLAGSGPAGAEEIMQLSAPAAEYTLGRFKYQAPKDDGWRQIAAIKDSLSLVYAEQPNPETISTLFGATLEVHDIPPGVEVASAAALADLGRTQRAEARKADLVALSAIEAVPGTDNLYTYRLLVRAPVPEMPDAYEVYYLAMAPDKSQYVVVQAITKTPDYGNELYFMQFYGSLASLKYAPAAASAAAPSGTAPNPSGQSEPTPAGK